MKPGLIIAAQSCDSGGMPRKLPLHVYKQKTRHDKWVFYFRIGKGKRTRLPNPTDDAFKAAYAAALTGGPVVVEKVYEGTLQWLWDRYTTESAKWAKYSAATQKQQSLIMGHVLKDNKKKALSGFTQDVILAGVDRRHETPAAAANFLKTMRGMCGERRCGWSRLIRLSVSICPNYLTEGFAPWTQDDVIAFRTKHAIGTHERLAMELMLLAGLRRSDVVRAGNNIHLAASYRSTL